MGYITKIPVVHIAGRIVSVDYDHLYFEIVQAPDNRRIICCKSDESYSENTHDEEKAAQRRTEFVYWITPYLNLDMDLWGWYEDEYGRERSRYPIPIEMKDRYANGVFTIQALNPAKIVAKPGSPKNPTGRGEVKE